MTIRNSVMCRMFQETCSANDLVHRMMAETTIGCLAIRRSTRKLGLSWNMWPHTHSRLGDGICCVRRCFRSWTTCYVAQPRQLLWYRTWDTVVSKMTRNVQIQYPIRSLGNSGKGVIIHSCLIMSWIMFFCCYKFNFRNDDGPSLTWSQLSK